MITLEQKVLIDFARKIGKKEKFILEEDIIKQIDWVKMKNETKYHRIFPIFYEYLHMYIPDKYKESYLKDYNKHVLKVDYYINELKNIIEIAKKNNINLIVLKGVALSTLIYGDEYKRPLGDLDILVPDQDLLKMTSLMSELGYHRTDWGRGDIKIPETVDKKRGLYHEFIYKKPLKININSKVEIKNASSAISLKNIDNFFTNTELVTIKDISFFTSNIIYSFVHLCSNIYGNFELRTAINEDRASLRDYLDLYAFLNKYGEYIDWIEIYEISVEYEITHKIFCVLNNALKIFNHFINQEILDLFSLKNLEYENNWTTSGTLVNWELEFIDRLFDIKERNKNFAKLFPERSYSSLNPNYRNPQNVEIFKDKLLNNLDEYYNFFSLPDNKIHIKYLPCNDKENLYFLFHVNDNIYDKLNYNVQLGIWFYNNSNLNELDSKSVMRFRINKNEHGSITTLKDYFSGEHWILEELDVNNETYDTVNGKIIKVAIPLILLPIDLVETNNYLCYNMIIFEQMVENHLMFTGTLFCNEDVPAETDNLGVLKLIEI